MSDTPLLNLFSEVPKGRGWSSFRKPVVVLDGRAEEWQEDRVFSGSVAYIVGANEKNLKNCAERCPLGSSFSMKCESPLSIVFEKSQGWSTSQSIGTTKWPTCLLCHTSVALRRCH